MCCPEKPDCRPHYHAFCPHCCHPAAACCCGCPQCRKEAKELVVTPAARAAVGAAAADVLGRRSTDHFTLAMNMMNVVGLEDVSKPAAEKAKRASESAFIGGGCCVHLSIEYMPDNPLAPAAGIVTVLVVDSDATLLTWAKVVDAKSGYQIHEDIITTHPGAKLTVTAVNVIARVRWCEVFSC